MKATINFNHIEKSAKDVETTMAEIGRIYLEKIAVKRTEAGEPYTHQTFFLRRTKLVTPASFDDYWAKEFNHKRFNRHITADERIKIATTEYQGHLAIDDNGSFNDRNVTFGNLSRLCNFFYDAELHRRSMAHRFAESFNLKAVSVTLSDKELDSCNYYRRVLLNAQS